jgi:hypothetical protein
LKNTSETTRESQLDWLEVIESRERPEPLGRKDAVLAAKITR